MLTPTETDELLKVMRDLANNGAADHLHHPQAPRGDGRLRHDHRAARRAGRRHHDAGGDRPGRPGQHDGRAQRRPAGREGRRPPRRRRAARSRGCTSTTTVATPPSTASTSRCGPGRSSASPASRATASASSSRRCAGCARRRAAASTFDGRDITHDSAHTINRLGVSHIPEDREKHGFVGLLLGGQQPRAGALRRAAVRQGHLPRLRGRPRQRPPSSSTASTSGRGTSTTRCAPCRAATSRR